MKIELPWITGRRLLERWGIRLSELHQAIFFLHLPVYNSDYEREEHIKYKEITNQEYDHEKWVYDLGLGRFNSLKELNEHLRDNKIPDRDYILAHYNAYQIRPSIYITN